MNRYRRGVYQPRADDDDDASTTTYCWNIRHIPTAKLILDRPFLTAFRSVEIGRLSRGQQPIHVYGATPQGYVATYQILGCGALLNLPVKRISHHGCARRSPSRRCQHPVKTDGSGDQPISRVKRGIVSPTSARILVIDIESRIEHTALENFPPKGRTPNLGDEVMRPASFDLSGVPRNPRSAR